MHAARLGTTTHAPRQIKGYRQPQATTAMAGEKGATVAATKTNPKGKTRPILRRVAAARPGPRVSGALGFPVPGGGFLLFGGYFEEEGEGGAVKRTATNETWRLDKDLARWEKVSSPAIPRARLAAAGAVASGSAWLLGGWDPGSKGDGGEILSDVWRFDMDKSEWSEAKLRQPTVPTSAAAAATPTPTPTPTATAAPSLPPAPATAVALPPGEDSSAFASLTGTEQEEEEDHPESIVLPSLPACSRAAATAIAVGEESEEQASTIALFTHRNGGDILLLDASDASSPVLRACVVAGDEKAAKEKTERAFDGSTALPASRGLTALASFRNPSRGSTSPSPSSSLLHLFGGAPKSGPMLGDSWFLELAPGWEGRLRGEKEKDKEEQGPTLRWSRQTSASSSSSFPPPRCSQAVGILSDSSLYLFGGAYYDPAGLLPLGDLWRLDLETREWEEVELEKTSSSPSPRNASAFGVVELPGGNKGLLIHGGWDPFRKTHDDTWLLTEEEEVE